jgi:hypothetical protein
MKKLKCHNCDTILKLVICFTGCDWDTKKGEGSGYGYPISLDCDNCGSVHTLGHVKGYGDFSEVVDNLKCVK